MRSVVAIRDRSTSDRPRPPSESCPLHLLRFFKKILTHGPTLITQMGQRKPVRVFQLIAADTVESKVLEIRECSVGFGRLFCICPERLCFVLGPECRLLECRLCKPLTQSETRKDDLVAKAFEKTSKETKRDKREARFEDIKALFGI